MLVNLLLGVALILGLGGLLYGLIGLWRNDQVFKARGRMLNKVSARAHELVDSEYHNGWRQLYDLLDLKEFSYREMCRKFWVPINDFEEPFNQRLEKIYQEITKDKKEVTHGKKVKKTKK